MRGYCDYIFFFQGGVLMDDVFICLRGKIGGKVKGL